MLAGFPRTRWPRLRFSESYAVRISVKISRICEFRVIMGIMTGLLGCYSSSTLGSRANDYVKTLATLGFWLHHSPCSLGCWTNNTLAARSLSPIIHTYISPHNRDSNAWSRTMGYWRNEVMFEKYQPQMKLFVIISYFLSAELFLSYKVRDGRNYSTHYKAVLFMGSLCAETSTMMTMSLPRERNVIYVICHLTEDFHHWFRQNRLWQ